MDDGYFLPTSTISYKTYDHNSIQRNHKGVAEALSRSANFCLFLPKYSNLPFLFPRCLYQLRPIQIARTTYLAPLTRQQGQELQTKVKRKFAKISKSQRRHLLGPSPG